MSAVWVPGHPRRRSLAFLSPSIPSRRQHPLRTLTDTHHALRLTHLRHAFIHTLLQPAVTSTSGFHFVFPQRLIRRPYLYHPNHRPPPHCHSPRSPLEILKTHLPAVVPRLLQTPTSTVRPGLL